MKKLITILTIGIATACSSSTETGDGAQESITPETIEKLKIVQDENIELEEIDGELDSLLTTLN